MSQLALESRTTARLHRAAADPRSAAALLVAGSIVLVGWLDGGYDADSWRWTGLALASVAGLQLLLGRPPVPGGLAVLSVASLAGLATWMLLSAVWGVDGTEARSEAERCAVYVAGLGALVVVVRETAVRVALASVIFGATTLAAFALGGRLVAAPALDRYQGTLLREPVGYANTLGLLTALGVVLAIGLLAERQPRTTRTALVVALGLCATALVLTSSRGAWLALAAGLGVLVAMRRPRAGVLATLLVIVGLSAIALLPRISLGDRPAYWQVAVSTAVERPTVGTGAGSFDDVWLVERPIPAFVRDAHSLYLETAAELGIVGLALLVCALALPLVGAARARGRPLVPAATAGYSVFLVHAGLDWDWEMPVTVLAGLSCGAALLATRQPHQDASKRPVSGS